MNDPLSEIVKRRNYAFWYKTLAEAAAERNKEKPSQGLENGDPHG
jgi:hypothetical protein